jgi:hypothetical protein
MQALSAVDLQWTAHLDSIWSDPVCDVPGLHQSVRAELFRRLDRLQMQKDEYSPLGTVLLGQAGSGKTHLLTQVRREAVSAEMTFVLADLTDVHDFWDTVRFSFVRSLQTSTAGNTPELRPQYERVLETILAKYPLRDMTLADVAALRPPTLANRISDVIHAVSRANPIKGREHGDVLRSLLLLASTDDNISEQGYDWLLGDEITDETQLKYGFRRQRQSAYEMVRGLGWLLSLRGPSIVAFDQLDPIVMANLHAAAATVDGQPSPEATVSRAIIEGIAGGLMVLRDITLRCMTVVCCLRETWNSIEKNALASAAQRFDVSLDVQDVVSPNDARQLLEARLATAYCSVGFIPPYRSWPFKEEAFNSAIHLRPRQLLQIASAHINRCLSEGVSELKDLVPRGSTAPAPSRDFSELERRFKDLQKAASPGEILKRGDDDLEKLVKAVCYAITKEAPPFLDKQIQVHEDIPKQASYAGIHGRVVVVHGDEGEREQHLSFRFLQLPHHNSVTARFKAAMTASGIDRDLPFRRLRILRRAPLPGGATVNAALREFQRRGGELVSPSDDDLRMLDALVKLRDEKPKDLDGWLAVRRPVSQSALLKKDVEWLCPWAKLDAPKAPDVKRENAAQGPASTQAVGVGKAKLAVDVPTRIPSRGTSIFLGDRMGLGAQPPQTLPSGMLSNHTLVMAGSGSGKTVFVRRVVEEAALIGIPSIVIDGANDLSRLGSPWPEQPETFARDDVEKAQRYLAETDVVIWTPGRSGGNPLFFEPLPNLAELADNAQELESGISLAVATLESALLKGGKASVKKGLLTNVLRHFAKQGLAGLDDLQALLSELPPEADGGYDKASQMARQMADELRAKRDTDPLLRAEGEPLDPSLLLGLGAPRTRVSVINLVGIPSLEAQQAFVSQLAMTLFSFIKKHPPAPKAPIQGLLVIDEAKDFVPSTSSVASKESLLRLARQGRKYGLGLVIATQEPKSVDHGAVNNCKTRLFGRASSPAAIEAVRDQLRGLGADGSDVPKLARGELYFHTEGMNAVVKIRTRLCLSHHPSSPPSEEEVLELAAASGGRVSNSRN